jgi:Holliday junction resolvasome RuvABC endonuclease subunit
MMFTLPAGDFCVMGIDQSLTGTGVCVLEGHLVQTHTKTIRSEKAGCARLCDIVDQLLALAALHHPALVAMEDVTRMASSASIIPLTELYAAIKLGFYRANIPLRIQNQSTMKKFVFLQGDVSKDTRYMLRVFDATGKHFDDDNQADAYGHAWTARTLVQVLRGDVLLSDLKPKRQEALTSAAMKESGMSDAKFKKLSDQQKIALLRSVAVPDL